MCVHKILSGMFETQQNVCSRDVRNACAADARPRRARRNFGSWRIESDRSDAFSVSSHAVGSAASDTLAASRRSSKGRSMQMELGHAQSQLARGRRASDADQRYSREFDLKSNSTEACVLEASEAYATESQTHKALLF